MPTDIKNLTNREKVGQLFFIGLPGQEPDAGTLELLERIRPAGVCLFARNTKEAAGTRRLLDSVRETLPFRPFLSLDQEGGLVDRLRRILEPLPTARDIGRTGDPSYAARLAAVTAEAIRMLGFNMNFAPVADVTTEERLGFVMDRQQRTYGRSAEEAYEFTSAYLDSLRKGGVLGCLKHFPGLGAVELDPHDELPSIGIDSEEFHGTDLLPFREHFRHGEVRAVMTAHAVYPGLDLQETDSDGKLLPSSLSHNVVTGLLRDRMGYADLVLTDDLEMGAIMRNYGIGEACKMAFLAGSDLLLICNEREAVEKGFEAMLDALENGEISPERIDASLERIFRVRTELQAPLEFSETRLDELSLEIKELKKGL